MIRIDVHEPIQIAELLNKNSFIIRETLHYADYTFGDITIERKTISDFFVSLQSGRLYFQLRKMRTKFQNCYLLIEGFFDFTYVTNLSWLYKQIQIITIELDVKILFTKDMEDTASIIRRIYFREKSRKTNLELSTSNIYKNYNDFFALRLLFDISYNKLKNLFYKFKSLRQLCLAEKGDVLAIEGISKKTAEKIESALNKDIIE